MQPNFKKSNNYLFEISNKKKATVCFFLMLFVCVFSSISVFSFSSAALAVMDSNRVHRKAFPDYLFPEKRVVPGMDSKKRLFKERTFIGEVGFSGGRISYNDKETGKIRNELRMTGLYHLSINLFENVFVRGTIFKQFQDKNLPLWTSDYYYILERFNWRPGTFSYGYENYTPNKYSADWEKVKQHMLQGRFYLSYGHNLPQKFINSIRIDNSTNWSIKYFVKYSINYSDAKDINYGEGKITSGKLLMGINSRYTIGKNFYIEGAIYYFPERNKLVAWDPDFTYGFGYFDWRSFKVNFSYGNWVVNRFPWNKKELSYYGFLNGDFKLTFSYAW